MAVMVRSHLLSLLLLGAAVVHTTTGAIVLGNLKTEYLTNPLGLDKVAPRFQWELLMDDENEAMPRGLAQVSYRIRVGTGAADGSVWDSGVVSSTSNFQVKYAGPPLKSATVYVVPMHVPNAPHTFSSHCAVNRSSTMHGRGQSMRLRPRA